ncbi:DNA-directed RNA polymerase sigma-70 factor [Dyadobacter frigoris]|nr:DNA-directed RNA polymerase sigma-70 factor [Dyadobacter frigoris]
MGDQETFEAIYRSYFAPLCVFAESYVGRFASEDIVENQFLKLWNKRQQFQDHGHLRAYFYRATKNACLDLLKTSKREEERQFNSAALPDDSEDSCLQEMIRIEVIAEIYRAINDLPSQCHKVITLGYIDGFSNDEIALQLGLSQQTVKNHKGRGLQLLREKLSDDALLALTIFGIFY